MWCASPIAVWRMASSTLRSARSLSSPSFASRTIVACVFGLNEPGGEVDGARYAPGLGTVIFRPYEKELSERQGKLRGGGGLVRGAGGHTKLFSAATCACTSTGACATTCATATTCAAAASASAGACACAYAEEVSACTLPV